MTEPAPQPAAPQPAGPLSEAEDKQWASFAHFGNIILLLPALIIWLVFRARGPKTNVEGKEAVNWTINVTGVVIALNILSAILGFTPLFPIVIVFTLIIWAVLIVNLIVAIMGGVKVNGGGSYRYPVNIRWIK
jgi:uncharacterized Tic20 family protein